MMNPDIDLIKYWLSSCETNHNSKCRPSTLPEPSKSGYCIRLIDVQRGCIVRSDKDARYAVLSYVWGQAKQLLLLQKSLVDFMSEGGLAAKYHELTTTIRDAIELCRQLGERYLWVDALCIIQDSNLDKMWQINRMGKIYGAASLTIVAASATDADASLFGTRNLSAETEPLDETDFREEFDAAMASCTWETRGWTFQEKVLSHRLLFFHERRVFFQCRNALWAENDGLSTSHWANSRSRVVELDLIEPSGPDTDLERYTKLVEEYTKRNLTKQEDALKAFMGILDTFSKIRERSNTFNFGLPKAAFDFTFCWAVEEHRPDLRRPEFPSWSWVGWRQRVSYENMLGNYFYTSDLVVENTEAMQLRSFESLIDPNWTLSPKTSANFSYGPNLVFDTSVAFLRVDRTNKNSSRMIQRTSDYTVCSQHDNSVSYGKINLDTNWRENHGDNLEFIVIRAPDCSEGHYITMLMCIEREGSKAFRVNILQCRIPVMDWKAARPKTTTVSLY